MLCGSCLAPYQNRAWQRHLRQGFQPLPKARARPRHLERARAVGCFCEHPNHNVLSWATPGHCHLVFTQCFDDASYGEESSGVYAALCCKSAREATIAVMPAATSLVAYAPRHDHTQNDKSCTNKVRRNSPTEEIPALRKLPLKRAAVPGVCVSLRGSASPYSKQFLWQVQV